MAKEKVFLMVILLALFALLGCGGNEIVTTVEVPEIEVKVVGKGMDLIEIPYLLVSITNIGRTEADIVNVDVYVRKDGDVVDGREISVWYLRPGETDVKQVRLYTLYDHDEYDSIELNARVVLF